MDIDVKTIEKPSLFAYIKQGTIEYYNMWLDTTLGIDLYLDTHAVEKEATIKTGVYTFGKLASWLLSAWALPSLSAAKYILLIIFGNMVIEERLEIIGTKIVVGYVSEYTWKGVPDDTDRGTTKYLNGYKVEYEDKNGNQKTYTEGYQESEFDNQNLTFGRLMFYGVYGIDEHPTTWK